MLRDRYEPTDIFKIVPGLTLAMEPEQAQLDKLLEDDILFQEVKDDLAKRFPRTLIDGRLSTPVEVILRMIVIKHLYGWSYEKTEHWVSDSLVLRQFCRVYLNPVPDDTTLIRWAKLIRPDTLHQLLDHVSEMAHALKVTRGRRLRTDGTVVETNIHHPSDSTLLGEGIRVLSRVLKASKKSLDKVTNLSARVFRDRTRSAKRQVKRIMEAARKRGEEAGQGMKAAYEQLLTTSQTMVQQAKKVKEALKAQAAEVAQKSLNTLDQFIPLMEQVINQTTRRVLYGELVPAGEKLVSLFEPHTRIISKGKVQRPTEFGRAVWLDEVDGGIISRYEILDGNLGDAQQIKPSLDHHISVFHKPPQLLTGDRGTYSADNERYAQSKGVKYTAIPKPGAKSPNRGFMRNNPGSGAAINGDLESRGESACLSVATSWDVASTTAKMVWNAG
ncbi:ISNCY family transposase [Dehalococcoidia bacterium]|nr:ISNCY family transposase [Dehalococcoidia bacterium]